MKNKLVKGLRIAALAAAGMVAFGANADTD